MSLSMRSLAFRAHVYCVAHKVFFAGLGASDYSSASIVVPFSVHTMTKRKPKGAAAGGTSAAVCCIRVAFQCLPAGTAKRREVDHEAESASGRKCWQPVTSMLTCLRVQV